MLVIQLSRESALATISVRYFFQMHSAMKRSYSCEQPNLYHFFSTICNDYFEMIVRLCGVHILGVRLFLHEVNFYPSNAIVL